MEAAAVLVDFRPTGKLPLLASGVAIQMHVNNGAVASFADTTVRWGWAWWT
jgi:hypothetical protein